MIILSLAITYPSVGFMQSVQQADPMGKVFFPPEMVMQNQQAISLSETQRNSIGKEMQTAQAEFMNMQWDLEKENEKLMNLLQKESFTEGEVLSQMDKMLAVENRIKKRQIALLIRIRGLLSPQQQEKLQRLKK